MYEIDGPSGIVSVVVEFDEYSSTSAIAVSLFLSDCRDLYDVITVNLQESVFLPYGTQFVDVNNNPKIGEWLIKNNLAKPTGLICHSGFCSYPAYSFNLPMEERVCKPGDDRTM